MRIFLGRSLKRHPGALAPQRIVAQATNSDQPRSTMRALLRLHCGFFDQAAPHADLVAHGIQNRLRQKQCPREYSDALQLGVIPACFDQIPHSLICSIRNLRNSSVVETTGMIPASTANFSFAGSAIALAKA